ncbi:hypothetical protein FA95DRAFT_1576713 [Auriscalpium vulgare]|uniref:Uncharacterized protein n=1 Tax=Auriscalpium vulgare TaxID=40419 RepID=A0ACB8RA12_9AGAM|nr:hypothetical protein FA95DRAFT_1576713 [Auriscalpium vulgare]
MAPGAKDAPVKLTAAARKLAAAGPQATSTSARQTRGQLADARAQSPTTIPRAARTTRARRPTAAANAAAGPSRDMTPALNPLALAGPSLASLPLDPFGGPDFPSHENPFARPAVTGERFAFWNANDRSPSPATIEETMASIEDAPWSPAPDPPELPMPETLVPFYQAKLDEVLQDMQAMRPQSPLSPAPASPASDIENLPPTAHSPLGAPLELARPATPVIEPQPTQRYVQPPSTAADQRAMARILYAGPGVAAALNPPSFTSGTFPQIHFVHHAVAFEDTSPSQITAWFHLPMAKLVVRPFEPPARTPTEQAPVAIKLAQQLAAITGLASVEVSAPQRSPAAINAGRYPKGYLAHGLTPDAVQLLLARGVWSSRELTFHAIAFEARLPSLLFRLAGLTTRDPAVVRRIVRFTWSTTPVLDFFAALVDSTRGNERPLTDAHIKHLIASMRATRVDFKQPGGILSTPHYAITIDSSEIPEDVLWYTIASRLKSLRYESPIHGTGVFEPLSLCLLCHGVDHPRGLCPFPDVPGWNGGGQRPAQFSAPPRHRAAYNPTEDARAEAAHSANTVRDRFPIHDRFPATDRFLAFQNPT